MLGLILAAVGIALQSWSVIFDLHVWIIVLLIQAIPYAASLLMALISAFPHLSARAIDHVAERDENRLNAIDV
jgi:hypothetical protein